MSAALPVSSPGPPPAWTPSPPSHVCVSFHININVGDAAIHIMLRTADNTVVFAVLVDGGITGVNDATNLMTTIEEIEHDYAMEDGTDTLKFDTVVITHWDKDHWGGIQALIEEDLHQGLTQLLLDTNDPVTNQPYLSGASGLPSAPDWLPVASLHPKINMKCSRFKYGPNYPTSTLQPDMSEWDRLLHDYKDPSFFTSPRPTTNVQDVLEPGREELRTTVYVPYTYTTSATATPSVTGSLPLYAVGCPDQNFKSDRLSSYADGGSAASSTTKKRKKTETALPAGTPIMLQVPFFSSNNGQSGYRVDASQPGSSLNNPDNNDNILDVNLNVYYQLATDKLWYKTFSVVGVARICGHYDHYLGAELFRNIGLSWNLWSPGTAERGWPFVYNPQCLSDLYQADAGHGPMMFLVAGYQKILGMGTGLGQLQMVAPAKYQLSSGGGGGVMRALAHPPSRHGSKVVDVNITQADLSVEAREADSHAKNAISLTCIIMVETRTEFVATAPFSNSVRLLEYFAGDALWDVECTLVNWVKNLDFAPHQIPLVKLSHHGSAESTPIEFLEEINPDFMVVTNAGSTIAGSHGHPRWELLFYLRALRMVNQNNVNNGAARPKPIGLYPTNYPYYLTHSDTTRFSLRTLLDMPKAFGLVDDPYIVYRLRLEALYKELGQDKTAFNLAREFRIFWVDAQVERQLRCWICEKVAEMWPELSPYTVAQQTSRGSIINIKCLISADNVSIDPRTSQGPGIVQPYAGVVTTSVSQPANSHSVSRVMHPAQGTSKALVHPQLQATPIQLAPTSTKDSETVKTRVLSDVDKARYPAIQGLPEKTTNTSREAYPDDLDLQADNLAFDADIEAGYVGSRDPGDSVEVGSPPTDMSIFDNEEALVTPEVLRNPQETATFSPDVVTALQTFRAGIANKSSSPLSLTTASLSGNHSGGTKFLAIRAQPSPTHQSTSAKPGVATQKSEVKATAPLLRDVVPSQPGAFLLGSDFLTGSADGKTEVLISDTFFSSFVAYLNMGAIALGGTFPTDGTVATVSVYEYDPWFLALQCNKIGTTSMSFVGSVQNMKATLTAVNATVVVGSKTLSFSTTETARVCQFTPPGTTTSLHQSVVPQFQILVAGLTVSNPALTFDLFELLQTLAGGTGSTGLPGWVDDFSMTLDSSASLIFYQPDPTHTNDMRLKFIAPNAEGKFKQLFNWLATEARFITLNNTSLIIHRTSRISDLAPNYELSTKCAVTLSTEVVITTDSSTQPPTTLDFTVWVVFGEDTTQLVIRFNTTDDAATLLSEALDWMVARFAGFVGLNLHPSSLLPDANLPIRLRQLQVTLQNPGTSGGFSMLGASVDFEITIHGVVFRVTLSWPGLSLTADLWLAKGELPIGSSRLLPTYEEYEDLLPTSGTLPSFIRIVDLIPGMGSLPSGIPDEITELTFKAKKGTKGPSFWFVGKVQCEAPSQVPEKMPILRIGNLDLFASYDFGSKAYQVSLSTTIFLFPRIFPDPVNKLTPAALELTVADNSGVWDVTASLYSVKFALIYSLFDSDAGPAVMNVMEHFDIIRLTVAYEYAGPKASSFVILGAMGLGPFELDFEYKYDSSGWSFFAQLGAKSSTGSITLGQLISEIAGPNSDVVTDLNKVPFVSNITIPATSGSPGDDSPIQLGVVKSGTHVVFWVELSIVTTEGTISLTFVQLQDPTPITVKGVETVSKPKRIIRLNVDNIPSLPSVPVVGTLPMLFDDLEYLWVQDPNITDAGTPAGLTRAELGMINDALQGQPIIFRDTTPSPPSAAQSTAVAGTSDNPVLLAGHHFIVSNGGVVVLDHAFDPPSTPAPPPKGQPPPPPPTADSGATIGSTKKSIGPLSIQNVGLQNKDGYLYVHVDATVALGPIILTFVGFAVGLPLSSFNLDALKHIHITDFHVLLDGLSVYMNTPPLLVAGTFIKGSSPTSEFYKGGITLSILPYTLLAVGAYERVYATPTTREFKSVFIFARLDGPLFSLEFAEISGVKAGFGYNSLMKLPDASQIDSYPLVEGSGTTANNPMDVLNSFGSWVSAADGPFWFAVGMKVDAFQILSIDATLLLTFDPAPVVAIIADAIAQMPPDAPRTGCFLYVELGIIGALDVPGGSFKVEAQVSPNSFVLYPACHLTGGFAMCYWFAGSPFAGDWVFTVGGYHPAYKPPAHYPNPPRLGISWNLDDCLTISGEAFFAVTPACCMGGGILRAVFNAGPLGAHFETWANFLINFKPFHFKGDIGESVGVSFHIDLWIIHIHIECDAGATLHLEGPPFGGVAHVDFYLFGFDVYFGDQNNGSTKLDWPGFLDLVKKPGPSDPDPTKSNPSLLVVVIEKGAADDKTDTSDKIARVTGQPWMVRAGKFQFRVESKFAMNDAVCGDGIKDKDQPDPDIQLPDHPNNIYARPMWKTLDQPLKSKLIVEITRDVPAGETPPVITPAQDDNNPWNLTPILRQLPAAIWTAYDKILDPTQGGGNNIDTLLNGTSGGKTVEHLCGMTIHSPDPRLPVHNMSEFNATDVMQEDIFKSLENPILPATPATQTLWIPPTQARPSGVATEDKPKWENVRNIWASCPTDVTRALVSEWTDMLGWEDQFAPPAPNAQAATDPPPPAPQAWVDLVPARPADVVSKEDFRVYYLELPLMTMVTQGA